MAALAATLPLAEVRLEAFDAVFYPGGHGPLWIRPKTLTSIALIEQVERGQTAGSGSSRPVIRHTRRPDGAPLVVGIVVTVFPNSEEAAVQLTDVVPFLVEEMLQGHGALYSKGRTGCPMCGVTAC